jgi:exosome complex component RRP42
MEITKLTKKRIQEYIKEEKRFDGRALLEHREIKIETDVIKNAEGSARVKFGDTEVLVGIKMDVGKPFPDNEDSGALITTVELLPLSSPRFEPGPPGIEAIELARIVDRGIRESGFIEFDKLCIEKGEKVWNILIDIYSINDAGNLIDISSLAAIAALKTAKFPKYDEKAERVLFGELSNKKLPLVDEKMPITITYFKIGKNTIIDPVSDEEESSKARISISSMRGKELKISAIQKGGEEPFSHEEIESIIDSLEKVLQAYTKKIEKTFKLG